MNLLADEGVDKPIVDRLRRDGHTVLYIAEFDPWSEEAQRQVGRAPGLSYVGGYGEDGRILFDDRCPILEEGTVVYRKDGKPFPSTASTIEMPHRVSAIDQFAAPEDLKDLKVRHDSRRSSWDIS